MNLKQVGIAGISIVLLAMSAMTAVSQASSGSFTKATYDATYSQGAFAGSVDWTGCPQNCAWNPVITVQPSLPSYRCEGDEAFDSDPDTDVVWVAGGQRSTNGSLPFDITDQPILTGVQGQRACLSVLSNSRYQEPLCLAQAPILGLPPSSCPVEDHYIGQNLSSAMLSVETPSDPSGGLSPAAAKSAAQLALKAKFGKAYKKAKKKQFSCVEDAVGYMCQVSWTYKRAKYKGTVAVSTDAVGAIKTKVVVKKTAANRRVPTEDAGDDVDRRPEVSTPCYRYVKQTVVYKNAPSRCDFAPPDCPVALCVDPFKDIKWKHYGRPTALAEGWPFINGPGFIDPIRFKLSKIRDPRCGPRVYTKIEYKDGGSYRLAVCR